MSGYKETYWQFDYYYAVVTKEKVMLKSQIFFGCCNLVGCIVDSNVNGTIMLVLFIRLIINSQSFRSAIAA